jgi:heat shock protein HslJ
MKLIQVFALLLVAVTLVQCKGSKTTATPAPMASLLNTYWRLEEVNGEPVQTPAGIREVHVVLTVTDQGNQLKGFAGCNNIGGSFTQDGKKLSFSTFSTKMMCSAGQMKVEDFLLQALTAADNYELKGETLSLLEAQTELATFQAVYLK